MFFLFIFVRKEGWFFGLPWLEVTPFIVRPLRYELYLSIKWFLPLNMSFYLIFLFFFIFFTFLSSTCCGVWLCCRTTVELFVGFRVGNSNGIVFSIR